MSLLLSTATHGPEIIALLYLDDGLEYQFVTGTAIGGPHSATYELVTTAHVNDDTAFERGIEIYRANLKVSGIEEDIPIVMKIATTEDSFERLVNEGRFYAAHLGPLVKDAIVPICYGAFKIQNPNGDRALGCLILQDCGMCLGYYDVGLRDRELDGRAANIRYEVLTAVIKMHEYGIVHGNLEFGHITMPDDQTPYFIDFENATAGHQCGLRATKKQLWGIPTPLSSEEVGCREVYDVCRLVNIFLPGTFECFDMHHDASYIIESKLEEVADTAPPETDHAEALREAYDAALAYLEEWYPDAAIRMERDIGTSLEARCRLYKERKEAERLPTIMIPWEGCRRPAFLQSASN